MVSVMTSVRGINVHYQIINPRAEKTIVFLHGFTGSTKTWDTVIQSFQKDYRIFAIDLIGHGLTDSPYNVRRYSMEEQVELLHEFFEARRVPSFTLVGYSMGGRVALAFAVKYAGMIEKLVLESSSPGLPTEAERTARRKNDRTLAEKIEKNGLDAFVKEWENIPLFESQKALPTPKQLVIRQERLNQRAVGLANSLRGMGTGQQPSYWDELKKMTKPVLLITGELDQKFQQKAIDMEEKFLCCENKTVPDVGHAVHVENPQIFATIIEEHLETI
ncbi:2-succinyl-6-hydroxy-2,4-cyclohexadiene-1-carboxylate synthase [Rummeliibacillus suwonensis]|uniref:2-succinyl-6-hydroxy-2, 4-cyclohexadiene-1-carboxylate synthase n=1 Tax=Rummeliibacillus suwonensis TaxID=1306154 RepID=UPI001FB903C3|nr:2-succinyl-6-hydroxy-2,4-cyclohexadiene-1-carboxylate synthase [Rummeliibacillus suwonensis]